MKEPSNKTYVVIVSTYYNYLGDENTKVSRYVTQSKLDELLAIIAKTRKGHLSDPNDSNLTEEDFDILHEYLPYNDHDTMILERVEYFETPLGKNLIHFPPRRR